MNGLSAPVVITRPLRQASALAQRIRAAGREAVIFPLLEILPLPDQTQLQAALDRLGDYALVAFVSPNAIDAAFAARRDWPHDIALAVMGEGSRAALATHGLTAENATIFSPSDRIRTDSQTLLEALDLEALSGKRVLILRGESGRELLADSLRARGVEVDQVAAYRRQAPVPDAAGRARLLQLLDADAQWVLTSSEAIRIGLSLAFDAGGEAAVRKWQSQSLVVPHARIAETARQLGFINILQTDSGDDAIVAALQFEA